jgi:A/G-specific adenine glycosylase
VEGILPEEEAVHAAEAITDLEAIRIKRIPDARHIFSHVEWHMKGYEISMTPSDEKCTESGLIYVEAGEIERDYPIPSAFAAYARYLNIHLGKKGPSYK